MSRHPSTQVQINNISDIAEEYVNYVAENALLKAVTLSKISEDSREDPVLQRVIKAIVSKKDISINKGDDKAIEVFRRRQNELTLYRKGDDEVLIVENKLVIPKSLQETVIKLAHEGHQGIVRTKQLFREISDYCK